MKVLYCLYYALSTGKNVFVILCQALAIVFYWLEYRHLYFRNPAFFGFWFSECGAYIILAYQQTVKLSQKVLYHINLLWLIVTMTLE